MLRGWLDWRLLLIGLSCSRRTRRGSANNWLTLRPNGHGQTAAVAPLFTAFAIARRGPIFGSRSSTVWAESARFASPLLSGSRVILFILGHSPWWSWPAFFCGRRRVDGLPLVCRLRLRAYEPAARQCCGFHRVLGQLGWSPAIGFLAQAVGLDRALWLIAALFVAAFAVSAPPPRRHSMSRARDRLNRSLLPDKHRCCFVSFYSGDRCAPVDQQARISRAGRVQ